MKHKHEWFKIGRPYQKNLFFEWCSVCGTIRMSWTEYIKSKFITKYRYKKQKRGDKKCI